MIEGLTWQVRFKLEVLALREDVKYIGRSRYHKRTRELAREFGLPVWLVRGLVEGGEQ